MATLGYEANKAQGASIARAVSSLLRKAGFHRAGTYSAHGTPARGYRVSEVGNGTFAKPTALLIWCDGAWPGREPAPQLAQAFAVIESDSRFSLDRTTGYITREQS